MVYTLEKTRIILCLHHDFISIIPSISSLLVQMSCQSIENEPVVLLVVALQKTSSIK